MGSGSSGMSGMSGMSGTTGSFGMMQPNVNFRKKFVP